MHRAPRSEEAALAFAAAPGAAARVRATQGLISHAHAAAAAAASKQQALHQERHALLPQRGPARRPAAAAPPPRLLRASVHAPPLAPPAQHAGNLSGSALVGVAVVRAEPRGGAEAERPWERAQDEGRR